MPAGSAVLLSMEISEEEFRVTVKAYIEAADGNRRQLADEFEFLPSTADCWATGTARPHSLLRAAIVTWIREQS